MSDRDDRDVELDGLRASLEQLDGVDLDRRAELFEDCHAALVDELNALEEVT